MKTNPNDPISAIQGQHGYLMDRKDIESTPLDQQLPGLTKREYFAAKFTAALLGTYDTAKLAGGYDQLMAKAIVNGCEMADNFIAQLNM